MALSLHHFDGYLKRTMKGCGYSLRMTCDKSAVSLLESRAWRYIRVIRNNNDYYADEKRRGVEEDDTKDQTDQLLADQTVTRPQTCLNSIKPNKNMSWEKLFVLRLYIDWRKFSQL